MRLGWQCVPGSPGQEPVGACKLGDSRLASAFHGRARDGTVTVPRFQTKLGQRSLRCAAGLARLRRDGQASESNVGTSPQVVWLHFGWHTQSGGPRRRGGAPARSPRGGHRDCHGHGQPTMTVTRSYARDSPPGHKCATKLRCQVKLPQGPGKCTASLATERVRLTELQMRPAYVRITT